MVFDKSIRHIYQVLRIVTRFLRKTLKISAGDPVRDVFHYHETSMRIGSEETNDNIQLGITSTSQVPDRAAGIR